MPANSTDGVKHLGAKERQLLYYLIENALDSAVREISISRGYKIEDVPQRRIMAEQARIALKDYFQT